MSGIVKGMQMPSGCRECPLCQYYPMIGETRCRGTGEVLASGFGTIKFSGRSEHCPLVELPEKHGRLIDADALITKRGGLAVDSENIVELSPGWTIPLESVIDIEPTVVEAEGE